MPLNNDPVISDQERDEHDKRKMLIYPASRYGVPEEVESSGLLGSAIQAGYSHSYARVIGHYFPKHRIKKLIKNMQNPLGKALAKNMKDNPESYSYRPSVREQKRMKAAANRRWREFEAEARLLGIEPE